jgi:hypothetical protein
MSVIVKVHHARKVKQCVIGMRKFFRKHNIDFKKFLEEGIPEEELIALNDAMAMKAVEIARGES